MPLTEIAIRNARPRDKAYRLTDGAGMYLEVVPTGGKYWRFKYRFGGKEKRLALGVYPEVGAKEARARRDKARKLLAEGIDPSLERNVLSCCHGVAMSGKFVAYYRVSTARQGASGLGLDAQREAISGYLKGGEWQLVSEFTEVETGKGSDALNKRPQLKAALDLCRKSDARLVIAKHDRLARNVHFISGLLEAKIKFVACDMPEANDMTIQIMAVFAEHEARRISERTKDALRAAKSRGVVLGASGYANLKPNIAARRKAAVGFANKMSGLIEGMTTRGLSQRAMVAELNELGVKTPRGGNWSLIQLQRMLKRVV